MGFLVFEQHDRRCFDVSIAKYLRLKLAALAYRKVGPLFDQRISLEYELLLINFR